MYSTKTQGRTLQEALALDIGGTIGKLEKVVTDNAEILAWFASVYGRMKEGAPGGVGTGVGTGLIDELMVYAGLSTTQPAGTAGALYEIMQTIKTPADLKWKLLDSPHLPTALFKVGIAAWAISEFTGLIPQKYGNLGKKVALGAGIAAVTLPGSGPYRTDSPTAQNIAKAPLASSYPY